MIVAQAKTTIIVNQETKQIFEAIDLGGGLGILRPLPDEEDSLDYEEESDLDLIYLRERVFSGRGDFD